MQIAGTTCGVCHKAIAFDGDGMGCPDCDATYHNACLEQDASCPKCRRDLNEAAVAMEREDLEARERAKRLHAACKVALVSSLGIVFILPRFFESMAVGDPPAILYGYASGIALLLAGIVASFYRALRKQP